MSYQLYTTPDPRFHFIPDPGKNFTAGLEPEIAARLDQLASLLHRNIYGVSGYRTPKQSVAVGGFANDPHTKGLAADIGIGDSTSASATALTEAELEKVGLTRPFAGAKEINHVQLLPGYHPTLSVKPGDAAILPDGTRTTLPSASPSNTPDAAIGGIAGTGGKNSTQVQLASLLARGLIDLLAGWIGAEAARAGLYVVFVVGGLALLTVGVSRALGLRQEATA